MESIGNRLKKRREELKLSVDKVRKETLIHPNVIIALEADRAHITLSPVYVKNFLAKYAKFLGLDAKELTDEYAKSQKSQGSSFFRNELSIVKKAQDKIFSNGLYAFYILLAILAAAFIFTLIFKVFSGQPKAVKPKEAAVVKKRGGLPARLTNGQESRSGGRTAPAPQPLAEVTPVKRGPFSLVITAREDCWVQIKQDGKMIFQSVLQKGNSKKLEPKDKVEFSVGDAKALDLKLDGVPMKLKASGPLKDVVVTKNGITKK